MSGLSAYGLMRPYARALIAHTNTKANAKDQVNSWLTLLATTQQITAVHEVKDTLATPGLSKNERATFLVDTVLAAVSKAAVGVSKEVEREFANLLSLLAEHNRLTQFTELHEAFRDLADDSQNRRRVTVQSTTPLAVNVKQKVEQLVVSHLPGKVEFTYEENPSVKGGIIARSRDWVMDASVSTNLSVLRQALTKQI